MASRLSDRLVKAGRVSADTMRAAIARQAVYGGSLDTALLETDAIDEPLLWEELGVATGLPMPEPALCENPVKCVNPDGTAIELDGGLVGQARAVPVGVKDGALQMLCGEPLARAELDAASERLGVPFQLYIVPEVRLAAVRQAIFDRPMPPRLLRLFARVAGAEPVRRWQTVARQAGQGRREARGGGVAAPVGAARRCRRCEEDGRGGRGAARAGAAGRARRWRQLAPPPDVARKPLVVNKAEVVKLIGRLYGREAEKARDELMIASPSRTSAPRRGAGRPGGRKHQDDDRVRVAVRGARRTRSRASARRPKTSCAS